MRIPPLNSPDDEKLGILVKKVADHLIQAGHTLVTSESCTGGWVAKLCTDLAGSSAWFDSGFVTYSDQAKQRMLGVSESTLQQHGAVSEATVGEMVQGALARSRADRALAISGIAGPGGATPDKPLGTVCFAWGHKGQMPRCETCHFDGDRDAVRLQAVAHALQGMLDDC